MAFSLLSLFSWVEKGQVKVRTWGIMHIPECSHRRVSCVCWLKNKSIEKRHSVTPSSHVTMWQLYGRQTAVLDHILRSGIRSLDFDVQHRPLYHTIAKGGKVWPHVEPKRMSWSPKDYVQFIYLEILPLLHCMLYLLRTWINCCNMAKGSVVRRCVFNFLQSANCYKIAGWLLASPFSGPPFLNCKAIHFKTVAQSPTCSFVI